MTLAKIEAAIEELVRPLIEADGGYIELLDVRDTTIVVRLSGACGGCPGATLTCSGVIEPAVRAAVGHEVTIELKRAAVPSPNE